MEIWIIFSKCIVILYLGIVYVKAEMGNPSWMVFSVLIYIGLNIAIYLIRPGKTKNGLQLASILILFISVREVDPLFLLLLPVNLYELSWAFFVKKWPLLLLGVLPVFFLRTGQGVYMLAALFGFIVQFMTSVYAEKLARYETALDKMRIDLQRLSKSLHENEEFIRQSEYTFRLEERNRISQQIHDSIGHSMAGALIQMEAAKSLLKIAPAKAGELLQNAINISKEGIEDIRVTLKNLKPATEQIGLQRLKQLVEDFSIRHQLKMPFVCKGNIDLISPIQWKIISENITEALTNSLKYSGATEISINIFVLNKLVRVEVRDNGKGAGSSKIVKGLGITGMEERTASIQGTIIVDGTNGFSVTTLLPIA